MIVLIIEVVNYNSKINPTWQLQIILFKLCISVGQRGRQKEGQIYLNYLFMQGNVVFSDLKKKYQGNSVP